MKLKIIKHYQYTKKYRVAKFSDNTSILYSKAMKNRWKLILKDEK